MRGSADRLLYGVAPTPSGHGPGRRLARFIEAHPRSIFELLARFGRAQFAEYYEPLFAAENPGLALKVEELHFEPRAQMEPPHLTGWGRLSGERQAFLRNELVPDETLKQMIVVDDPKDLLSAGLAEELSNAYPEEVEEHLAERYGKRFFDFRL